MFEDKVNFVAIVAQRTLCSMRVMNACLSRQKECIFDDDVSHTGQSIRTVSRQQDIEENPWLTFE